MTGERADPPSLDPPLAGRIWGLVGGFTAYFAVRAADELGVFSALAAGPAEADEVARRCGADPARMLALLSGNVAAGALERRRDGFALAPLAAAHLRPDSPAYLGALLRHSPGPLENWPALAETVRGAPPPRDVGAEGGAFFVELARATFPAQLATARAGVASMLPGRLRAAAMVLDLGAGAAPWTVAVLEALPEARAVVNELDAVVPLARRQLDRHGVGTRAELLPGDYWKVHPGDRRFDLVVLGHVCRAEGDEGAAALVRRASSWLAPGGRLLVAEYLLDDDRAGPSQAQLLGVTMMANTQRGATFTVSQACRWLEAAGLQVEGVASPAPPTSVVLGVAPGTGPGGPAAARGGEATA